MSSEDRLAALERQVQYLVDRRAILDCITRNARGNDRFDAEVTSSSYHEDGLHEIGTNRIPGPSYGEHANEAHAAICERSLHHVTNHSCEIDGDVAHAETYSLGLFLDKGGKSARILSGRYLDRLERRDGDWRIVVRRATVEVVLEGDAAMLDAIKKRQTLKGSRDKSDPSYQRPLTLEGGERW